MGKIRPLYWNCILNTLCDATENDNEVLCKSLTNGRNNLILVCYHVSSFKFLKGLLKLVFFHLSHFFSFFGGKKSGHSSGTMVELRLSILLSLFHGIHWWAFHLDWLIDWLVGWLVHRLVIVFSFWSTLWFGTASYIWHIVCNNYKLELGQMCMPQHTRGGREPSVTEILVFPGATAKCNIWALLMTYKYNCSMIDIALRLDPVGLRSRTNYLTCSIWDRPLRIINRAYFQWGPYRYALMQSDGWKHVRLIGNPIYC